MNVTDSHTPVFKNGGMQRQWHLYAKSTNLFSVINMVSFGSFREEIKCHKRLRSLLIYMQLGQWCMGESGTICTGSCHHNLMQSFVVNILFIMCSCVFDLSMLWMGDVYCPKIYFVFHVKDTVQWWT